MLTFPNCKINLGLYVTQKRPDGFHNIETLFYPVNFCDALEVLENENAKDAFTMTLTGIPVKGDVKNNLIYKAWDLIRQIKNLPAIKVHLHKNIPMGAGLGGGSSDAAYFITALNSMFDLRLSELQQFNVAKALGSDCAFFINNQPVFANQRGDVFTDFEVDLSNYYILVVYPGIESNTKTAYEGIVPKKRQMALTAIVSDHKIEEWKHLLINDFEFSIFHKYPQIEKLKERLYQSGALYASLSGSGSAVYGIFSNSPEIAFPKEYVCHLQKPKRIIL
jgi:4-diphosphocytidyl-2-C-methyl-D-erythritol kinase